MNPTLLLPALLSLFVSHGGDGSHFGLSAIVIADRDGDEVPEILASAPMHLRKTTGGCLVVLSGKTGAELERDPFSARSGASNVGPRRLQL